MKVTLPALAACLLVFLFPDFTSAQSQKTLPEGVSTAWYQDAVQHLTRSAYVFKKDGGNKFVTSNASQHLRFTVTPAGYQVSALQQDDWKVSAVLLKAGNYALQHQASAWTLDENRLLQHYDGIDVEYVHQENGLRQNFIVKEKKGPLEVSMRLYTDLTISKGKEGQLSFRDQATGREKLQYADLKVWDATGKNLPAVMDLDEEKSNVTIRVDDATAVYPVTIDPLNHNPEWTSSAEGVLPGLLTNLQLQVEGLHGFTVAALGDINNDGYDDVAISAPALVNIIAGNGAVAGVGAVFIYMGSATGLGAAPAHTLQPSTAVANALFGFSVAGGDVTGDGINDIIIGAPLDEVNVDIGGGSMMTSRVGRVYIYQGGPSLTGANPAPLLSLHLQTPLLSSSTIIANPLFGFSLAVTDDLNNDGKGDIIVGAPTYARLDGATAVKTGGAFIYLSNAANTFTAVRSLTPPTGSVLNLLSVVQSILEPVVGSIVWNTTLGPLLSPLLAGQINGLLFGYSVDGAGNYNSGDTHKDVIVGAPAGVDLGSLNGALSGQILGGTAWVFTGTGTDINTTSAARLQAASSGLLSNAANLFGYRVKGRRGIGGERDGAIFVTAPVGAVLSNVVGALRLKAGQVCFFQKRTSAITNPVTPSQTLASPRSSSLTSLLTGSNLNLSVMFGGSIDNMRDADCDGYPDIIVGEPLSTSVGLVGTDIVGGAAYIFKGLSSGLYDPVPSYILYTHTSPVLGVNATGLMGFSVAGAGYTSGGSAALRPLVAAPANSLDFSPGLLNLGNTISTLNALAFENNGLGKSFTFNTGLCASIPLPVTLRSFTGFLENDAAVLKWEVSEESGMKYYELERSANNRDFLPLSLIFANNERDSRYSYTDKKIAEGINYYRLKMVDDEHKVTYSSTVIIRLKQDGKPGLTAGPSPFRSQVNVRFTQYKAGIYEMRMVDVNGRIIQSGKIAIASNDQQVTLRTPDALPAGVYWLNILGPDGEKAGAVALVCAGQ